MPNKEQPQHRPGSSVSPDPHWTRLQASMTGGVTLRDATLQGAPVMRGFKRSLLALLVFVITACGQLNRPVAPAAEASATVATQRAQTAVLSATYTAEPPEAQSISCDAPVKQLQQVVSALTNAARQQGRMCGHNHFTPASPLLPHSKLQQAAALHSRDMAENDFFSHTGSTGTDVGTRVEQRNYLYQQVAENIAAGQLSLQEAHAGWLASPAHCEAIMEPAFTDIGVACQANPDSNYVRYWTAVYGKTRERSSL